MMGIEGKREAKEPWFGGARVATGGNARTRPLGSLRVEVIPAAEEGYSEVLGSMTGPITGEIALGRLGPTRAERATERSRRVDRLLAGLGIPSR